MSKTKSRVKVKVFGVRGRRSEGVNLKLKQSGDFVTVDVVDEHGVRVPCGSLLVIDADGIQPCAFFDRNLGIAMSGSGQYANEARVLHGKA